MPEHSGPYTGDPLADLEQQAQEHAFDITGADPMLGPAAWSVIAQGSPALATQGYLRDLGFTAPSNPFTSYIQQYYGDRGNLADAFTLMTPGGAGMGTAPAQDIWQRGYIGDLARFFAGQEPQESLIGMSQVGDWFGDLLDGGLTAGSGALGSTIHGLGLIEANEAGDVQGVFSGIRDIIFAAGPTAFHPTEASYAQHQIEQLGAAYWDGIRNGAYTIESHTPLDFFAEQAANVISWLL